MDFLRETKDLAERNSGRFWSKNDDRYRIE